MRLMIVAVWWAVLAGCADTSANDAAETPAAEEKVTEAPQAGTPQFDNQVEPKRDPVAADNVSACLIQDGEQLRITPVRAIGTEPFWNAQVEGCCVTYSTPEDQMGTWIWTRFNPGPDGGVWVGSLDGKPFNLITRLRQGCSDGMSDRNYPLDAMLTVRGEERTGCAGPDRTGKR
jgi:uncharacterized membrane protein